MEESLSKEKVEEYLRFKGEIRGVGLKNYAEFILKEDGEEGLKELEETVAKYGCPIKYKELNTMDFYPIGYQAVTIAAMKDVLHYDDDKFYRLGGFQPKISLIIKLFMRYFISLDRLAKEVPKMWRKYYTVGKLEVLELNKEKKYMKLALRDFPCHPTQCHQTLRGYFPSVLRMVVKGEVSCEETKCVHRGDEYHEYILRWS